MFFRCRLRSLHSYCIQFLNKNLSDSKYFMQAYKMEYDANTLFNFRGSLVSGKACLCRIKDASGKPSKRLLCRNFFFLSKVPDFCNLQCLAVFFFAGLQFMVCHEVKWKRCSRIKMIKWHALNVMLVIAHEDGAWYGYRSKFNWYHLSLFYLFFLTFFFFPVPLI